MLTDYQKGSIFGATLLGIAFGFSFATYQQPAKTVPQTAAADVASNEQKQESFWQWAMHDPVSAFTFALVVVGGIQAGLFLWQLGLIRDSLIDAEKAAEAATVSARAAQETVEIMKDTATRQLRAYVSIGLDKDNPPIVDMADQVITIPMAVINKGQTPAYRLTNSFHIGVYDFPLNGVILTHPPASLIGAVLPQDARIRVVPSEKFICNERGRQAFIAGEKRIYVSGEINYVDAFKKDRFTKFKLVSCPPLQDGSVDEFDYCEEGNDSD